jgi:hypothetical protein
MFGCMIPENAYYGLQNVQIGGGWVIININYIFFCERVHLASFLQSNSYFHPRFILQKL